MVLRDFERGGSTEIWTIKQHLDKKRESAGANGRKQLASESINQQYSFKRLRDAEELFKRFGPGPLNEQKQSRTESHDLPQDFDLKNQFELELETERAIARSDLLAPFRRNATGWELLLMLAAQGGESDLGVYKTLHRLETGFLGQSSLLKFLRDRRNEGMLTFDEHEKRSKWRVRLAPNVHAALIMLLEQRNKSLGGLLFLTDERYQDDTRSVEDRWNGMMR